MADWLSVHGTIAAYIRIRLLFVYAKLMSALNNTMVSADIFYSYYFIYNAGVVVVVAVVVAPSWRLYNVIAGLDPNGMHPEGWSPLHAAASDN